MIIAIASGKGGTGKTTVAVNLALSLEQEVQILDCDVEEPNVHLFLNPVIEKQIPVGIPVPDIDETLCTYCGKCSSVCAYGALSVIPPRDNTKGTTLFFHNLCHGCGACQYFCPEKAIREVSREIGTLTTGTSDSLEVVSGILHIGEAMSPPLIRKVKEHSNLLKTVIIDAPPGTSCPVVTSLKGSDFCIIVTEPTPFGLHDLSLIHEVVKKLNIPIGVIINRSDLGDDQVEKYCSNNDIPLFMKIPFDREIALLTSQGIPFVRNKRDYKVRFQNLYEKVTALR